MRTQNKLSAKAVAAAKFEGKPRKLFDGNGLFLHVQAGGRYWRLKYRHNGAEKLLALGVYPAVSLAAARVRRDEARTQLADGIDPVEQRRAEKTARGTDTFEAVAREWLENQAKVLAAETLRLTRRRFETWVFPIIGAQPMRALEPPELLRLLRRIEAKGKHETASRVRQRIGQVFRYAIATGRADRDPTADLKGALIPAATQHRAAITTPAEFGALLRAIDGYSGQPASRAALRLAPLTFVRPGELRMARWPEIDLEAAIWRIPSTRMKMKREHIVPLSRQAVAILQDLHPVTSHRPYVFESVRPGRPLSENTMNTALRTMGYSGDMMTPHGFRASASTLLHELGWAPEVIELQLAHAQRSQVAAAYNRSARLEERRRMMQAWADYLDSLRDGANVVALGQAKQLTG
ncbi:MAG: integrase arm-type DNA-binding domain-containing protein [Porticoccaceae bacterium]